MTTQSPDNGIASYVIKTFYGKTMAYPANTLAEKLCCLTNTKILCRHHISVIESLGFKLQFQAPDLKDFDPSHLD
tara:strand:- start:4129 stop:4353 length:225 start_codon:yes stop_codon:yes gene_type:complete